MNSILTCNECSGFIPSTEASCPNCSTSVSISKWIGPLKAVVTVATGAALAMTLSACYGSPCAAGGNDCHFNDRPVPQEPCREGEVDNDEDGFCGEYDCDDSNPDIHILADEIPNDGVDQNCNGEDNT